MVNLNLKNFVLGFNRKKTSSPLIHDAKTAYKFENSGVTKISKNGDVVLKFNCPQLYKTKSKMQKNNITFFRHVHFVVEGYNQWDPQIYTKIVVCKYKIDKFIEEADTGLHVIINALPSEYFAKDHIPNSFNLYYKTIAKMTSQDLHSWFNDVCRIHYPNYTYIKNKKISIYEIPIIT